jgi:hypothetical protein
MSVIWHKVWHDLWSHKGRTLLAILSIAAGLFAVGGIFGLVDQLLAAMDSAHRAVVPSHANIILRDFVTQAELEQAAKALTDKGKDPEVKEVKRETLCEGPCIQMLHLGPFENEWETISQLLEFAREAGYESHGRHHEIYLSDPRRVPPERLKTILRMPVRQAG